MGFQTVPEVLRTARRHAAEAVAELRGVDCGGPVRRLAAAMPGGTTAETAPAMGESWTTAFKSWCIDAEAQAESLATAAERYQATDEAGNDDLAQTGSLRGPR